jgi:hypothetical protein
VDDLHRKRALATIRLGLPFEPAGGLVHFAAMRVFIDFEASSLNDDGYPIEVGWVFEDGRGEGHLIKPAAEWTDWDDEAESLHGISRSDLQAGTPHDVVARRVLDVLGKHDVYATAPSWDGKWLSVLLRGAGLPRHAMRLKDSDELHAQAVAETLGGSIPQQKLAAITADLLEQARDTLGKSPVRHRAQDDAERERQVWLEVRRLAQEMARSGV